MNLLRAKLQKFNKEFFIDNLFVFLSYFAVFAIILVVYALLRIYPFGEFSILKSDLFHSYAPTLNDIKTKILNGESLLYSWSGGLGSNLLTGLITAGTSVFNILMFLFPIKYTPGFIATLIIVKIPFGAVTFFLYIRNKFNKNDVTVLIFSVLYALCAYATALHWNIMWLDAVILLPFVALGIDKLYADYRSKFYCVWLAIAIFSNFATAIFLCCFSVVYFWINWFLTEDISKEIKRRIILRYTMYSLLSGGIAAVYIFSVTKGLQSSHYLTESMPVFAIQFNALRFLINHFWGTHPTVLVFSNSVPNIYAGVLAVLLLPLFLFNKSIRLKKRLLYFGFLIILFLCFEISILTFMLHGFHFPAMMPHRYSFVYSFVLLIMSYEAFINLDKTKYKHVFITYILMTAVLVVLYFMFTQDVRFPKPGKISLLMLAVNLILITVYVTFIVLYKREFPLKVKQILLRILVGVIAIEAISNTYIHLNHLSGSKSEYYALEFNEAMSEVSQILKEEPEFYRAEFKHYSSLTDPKIFDYNGYNSFAGIGVALRDTLDRIGVSASTNVMTFTNPSPVITSIFNQKYLFNRRSLMQETFTMFEFKRKIGNIFMYENPYVLPLGFMVNEELQDFSYGDEYNPYVLQNDFVKRSTGLDEDVFSLFNFDNYTTEHIKMSPMQRENGFIYEIDENVTFETIPLVTFEFIAPESKYTFMHVRTNGATRADVLVNGNYVLKQGFRRPSTSLDAGFVEKGSKIEVVLSMDKRSEDEEQELIRFGDITVNAAQIEMENFENAINVLKRHPFNVTYYDNVTIKGNISTEKEGIMFTSIPYDIGAWEVSVDGKKIKPRKISDAFIAVKLYPGEHYIEFNYKFPVLYIGLAVSVISLLLLLAVAIHDKKALSGEDDKELVNSDVL